MPNPDRPETPLSREDVAKIEIGHTTVAAGTVRVLLTVFLIVIGVVPCIDSVVLPAVIRSGLNVTAAQSRDASLWHHVVARNRTVLAGLETFERALEDRSLVGRSLRPRAQVVMTGWLGAGNERVYPGREGWLFYRPEVEYLTGRGFLESSQLAHRVTSASEWASLPQPDPREAIARFHRDLASRGITLVVMPTPVKPGVHPERLARRYAGATGVLQNPSYRQFIDDVRRDGVLVFDPSDVLTAGGGVAPRYLATDTHWRPETMEEVAEALASFVQARVPLPPAADPGHRLARLEVQNGGDITRMLDLPGGVSIFPPESVWLRRVLLPDGSPWRSSRDADVLVLGDSFSNIYSLESMGWGTSAGFAEQLSYTLGRPVDRLVQNDEGAFATRAMLQQDPGRLNGKRVVIYQFAARELAFGDWKVLPLRVFAP